MQSRRGVWCGPHRSLAIVASAGLCLALGLLAASAAAEGEDVGPMRRIDFAVARGDDVENDRARAVLAVTDEDTDPQAVAERVNAAMTWALETSKRAKDVTARTGSYRTFPVTREAKIRRWRARQELVIESADLPALTQLVGTLQERVQLDSIGFQVSPERRRETVDRLIVEALDAYRARADRIRDALGATGYTLVHLSIETDGGPPPRPYAAEMAVGLAAVASVAPALEAGTSRVTVAVHATIELR